MDSKTFIANATRTESRIPEVRLGGYDMRAFMEALQLAQQVGKLIDTFKRHIYYGKPLDRVKVEAACRNITKLAQGCRIETEFGGDEKRNQLAVHTISNDPRVVHAIVGMFGECGELVEALLLSENEGKPIDRVSTGEELGDLDWYKAVILDAMSLDEVQIRETVIAKLKKRYGDKFTPDAAINRDVAAERVVLEESLCAPTGN